MSFFGYWEMSIEPKEGNIVIFWAWKVLQPHQTIEYVPGGMSLMEF